MKKILKWAAIVTGGLIVLIFISGFVLYSVGKKKLSRHYPDIKVRSVSIPTDASAIERGKHISIIWGCTKCHGEDLSGKFLRKDPVGGSIPLFATLRVANLTPGKGGVGSYYNTIDWIRAIRHGVKPNNKPEIFMYFSTMSDPDLGDLIAYLKQIPPVDTDSSMVKYGPLIPVALGLGIFPPSAQTIDHNAVQSQTSAAATAEYGRYLSAICAECHGSDIRNAMKGWDQEDFVRSFQTGMLPNGKSFGKTMSSKTFTEMTNMELSALWLYFQNQTVSLSQK